MAVIDLKNGIVSQATMTAKPYFFLAAPITGQIQKKSPKNAMFFEETKSSYKMLYYF